MRILILEHLCVNADDTNDGTLADEGFAMVRAASRDLAQLGDVDVLAAMHPTWKEKAEADEIPVLTVPIDVERFATVAASFDGVLLIAPEINGVAVRWATLLERSGATLLGPSSTFVAWASDKVSVAQSLPECSPPTTVWSDHSVPKDWGGELILKPRDGVGALSTMIVSRELLPAAALAIRAQGFKGELIVQPYVHGRSVSVAVVPRDRGRAIVLPAVEQIVVATHDPLLPGVRRLKYHGGVLPAEEAIERARVVAMAVMEGSPSPRGWIGIDMILADDSRDVVVDVNPRLTTSYLGYSSLFPETLARLILGRETSADLQLLAQPPMRRVRFDVCGNMENVD